MTRHWTITSNPANLRTVRTELEAFAESVGMTQEASHALGLVLNEALANTIRHGYSGAVDKPIDVTAENSEKELRLVIRDWGKPFDPATVKKKCEGEISPGGLGLMCIRKLMDEVHYERLPDGMLLRLIKKLG
jgi:serine/threonine-protein kinase RsbW